MTVCRFKNDVHHYSQLPKCDHRQVLNREGGVVLQAYC